MNFRYLTHRPGFIPQTVERDAALTLEAKQKALIEKWRKERPHFLASWFACHPGSSI